MPHLDLLLISYGLAQNLSQCVSECSLSLVWERLHANTQSSTLSASPL